MEKKEKWFSDYASQLDLQYTYNTSKIIKAFRSFQVSHKVFTLILSECQVYEYKLYRKDYRYNQH